MFFFFSAPQHEQMVCSHLSLSSKWYGTNTVADITVSILVTPLMATAALFRNSGLWVTSVQSLQLPVIEDSAT